MFVANAIYTYMKNGNLPTEKDSDFLDRMPLIDALRQRVSEEDISWLMDIVENEEGVTAGLCCSLLRKHSHRQDVKTRLEGRWDSASAYLKNRLMWRMLDNSGLSLEWHQRFLDFVLEEWEVFSSFNLKFLGRSQQGISNIISRLEDSTFPESKKWIYLCCVPAVVEDPNLARLMIRPGQSMADPFAQKVTRILLERFFSDENREEIQQQTASPEDQIKGLDFVSYALVSYMRNGNKPTEVEADYLNRLPIVDKLRGQMTEEDLRWIADAVEKESGEVCGLYLSLLQKFDDQSDIQMRLRRRWENADAFLRAHLMWRILDDPNLVQEWHKRLFVFVLEEWDVFNNVSLKSLGTPQTVVIQALKRIGDSNFPDSKKWAYLCRVPGSAEDQDAARALLHLGLSMNDEFARHVAGDLLKRFYQTKPAKAAIS
jgi:hypothetical protein